MKLAAYELAKLNRLPSAQPVVAWVAAASISALVLIGGLLIWLGNEVWRGGARSATAERVVYLDALIAPIVQELAHRSELSAPTREALSNLLARAAVAERIKLVRIWSPGGTIVFSTDPARRPAPRASALAQAFEGQVVIAPGEPSSGALNDRRRETNGFVAYYPLREAGTNRIIAVAELHEPAERFTGAVTWRTDTLAMVGFALFAAFALLASFAYRLFEQRNAWSARAAELSRLLIENFEFQKTLRQASVETAHNNERTLRQIGADLHDGPAQLVGLALLRLDNVKAALQSSGTDLEGEFKTIRSVLWDALVEVRHIAAGVAPPVLEGRSPAEVVEITARTHESRTGTCVDCELGRLPPRFSPLLHTCIYRFIQEGLNNAYKHAGGKGQTVAAKCEDGELVIEVRDSGPGIAKREPGQSGTLGGSKIGLAGLRARVESLNGKFECRFAPNAGTRLIARFHVNAADDGASVDAGQARRE
ncbi:MAG: hypothetical protein IT536_19280 [Hyphomicrobiales bacterium]|nr:hypothetical protein [Hyphomicrobiales bacterium]